MSSYVRKSRKNTPIDGLSPLLSHVAGVMENVREATFSAIKNEVERDVGKKLSDTDISKALENGINLGVINMKRQFKVCREFTTKELKKPGLIEFNISTARNADVNMYNKNRKLLMDYVRRERLKRKNKLNEKKKKGKKTMIANNVAAKNELDDYLCNRCKKSLEKKVVSFADSPELMYEENESGSKGDFMSCPSEVTDCSSRCSNEYSDKETNTPEKSKLLVENNPMETDPPYCDIFT